MENKIIQTKQSLTYLKRQFNIYIYNDIVLYVSCCFTYIMFSMYSLEIYQVNMSLFYIMYWLGLGILSTIGFGFGFHTGIFFLFPNVINTYDLLDNPSYTKTMVTCLPKIVLWGIGSGLGELPPYLVSKNCDKTKIVFTDHKWLKKIYDKCHLTFYKLCIQYIDFKNRKIIFGIILILSSWPNATFDMCGLICGYYDIKLLDFIFPTIIGKGLIKAPLQCLVVLYLYVNESDYKLSSYSPVNINVLLNILFIVMLGYVTNKSIIYLSSLEKHLNKIE